MSAPPERAVVIGASVAGLLAARALSEAYPQVVVVDRDELPDDPSQRDGVPQGRHGHTLLAGGREALEALLPGLTEELVALGAGTGDVQERTALYVGDRPLAPGHSGLTTLMMSRPLLEWTLRRRVGALPGVTVLDRRSALDLTWSADRTRVTGVFVAPLDPAGATRLVPADLVVDASGRTSRTTEWLARHQVAAPPESRVRVDLAMTTRHFRRQVDDAGGALAVAHRPTRTAPRAGLLLAQEGDVWAASLTGYHGDRPPTALADFTAYARTLCSPVLADLVAALESLDDGSTCRFPANVRRHYEELAWFPDGLLVTGDALCAVDPTLGQGTTLAALEALALRDCLRRGRDDLAVRFFRQAATDLEVPWAQAVAAAPLAPGATARSPMRTELGRRYTGALQAAGTDDPLVAGALLRVGHLTAAPSSLLTPRYAVRALRAAAAPPGGRPAPPAHLRPARAPRVSG